MPRKTRTLGLIKQSMAFHFWVIRRTAKTLNFGGGRVQKLSAGRWR